MGYPSASRAYPGHERQDETMTTNQFQVTGMTCGHCESAVRREVTKVAGVEQVEVSASNGRLVVTSTADLDDAEIIAAVDEAGYDAVRVP
jgi:copper chaperone